MSTPSQSEVLILLENNKSWMTSKEVADNLKISKREMAAKFLRKLWEFDFLERKRKEGEIEYRYKIKETSKSK